MRTVLALHGPRCVICRGARGPIILDAEHPDYARLGPSVEHLLPRSRGGSDHLDNLRPAHRSCNSSRGNRDAPAIVRPVDGRSFFQL